MSGRDPAELQARLTDLDARLGQIMDAVETLGEALAAGCAMRERQRLYFRLRTREALIASKEAEARFDKLMPVALARLVTIQLPVVVGVDLARPEAPVDGGAG